MRCALAASLEQGTDGGVADGTTIRKWSRGWWWCGGGSRRAGIPRYKATLQRMQETLAVSYRWQEKRVSLGGGMSLNMSAFQRTTLLEAIQTMRPEYVWVDQLSVPQDGGPLTLTLLSRMMAVYAAASSTVAVRSAESPGNRYHQRVWTCQEFCTARRLRVRTERKKASGSDALAILGHEDQEFEELRMQFRSAGDEVVPLWLRQGRISAERARATLCTYRSLSDRLFCEVSTDKIHALVPLLARTPVCSQEELQKLVHELGDAAGEDVASWEGALEEQANVSMRSVAWGGVGSEGSARRSLRLPDWLLRSAKQPLPSRDIEAGRWSLRALPSPSNREARKLQAAARYQRRTYTGVSASGLLALTPPTYSSGSWSGEVVGLVRGTHSYGAATEEFVPLPGGVAVESPSP
jgi:hypothetical protein